MKILVFLFVLLGACSNSQWTTSYTKIMKQTQEKKQFKPKAEDKGFAQYFEGTVIGTGTSKLDGEVSILEPIRDGMVDGVTSATRLFRGLEPGKGTHPITFSKETIELFFLGAMTNNLEDRKLSLPELTLKLFVRKDNNNIEYAEWEYFRIGCRNLTYYGTYRIIVTNGVWDPNATGTSRPGTATDAIGTATWDPDKKEITFTTVFTDNENKKRTVNSVFKFNEIYREYEAILRKDYEQYTDYHIYNKKS